MRSSPETSPSTDRGGWAEGFAAALGAGYAVSTTENADSIGFVVASIRMSRTFRATLRNNAK